LGSGRNLILVWTPLEKSIEVLMIPHYTISEQAQRAIQKFLITDKHGLTSNVFNAKINIYRVDTEQVYSGLQPIELAAFDCKSISFN